MPDRPQPTSTAAGVTAVVLVGMMGAGKSTVGALLAERLGWRFIDLDSEIERVTGQTIPEIFAARGEPAFRALERELTARIASSRGIVLAPGGGWILQDANPAAMPAGTRYVWLRVSPEVAVQRIRQHKRERPLLQGGDPVERARHLSEQREPLYRTAGREIDTDAREPADIAAEIADWIALGDRAV